MEYFVHKKSACEMCGKKSIDTSLGYFRGTKLTVHHIDGNIQNNSLENLQTLCRPCHDKVHGM